MALDAKGNLYVCEHVTSRVVVETPQGRSQVVASRYLGKELNSPNDIIVASDGSVIFTDPDWGRTIPSVGLERPRELDITGVYRSRGPGSELQLLADDFVGPNGLCFSPDEKLLYINDTIRGHIRVFEVRDGYRLGGGRVFAEDIRVPVKGAGVVDGMKVDLRGNVYVTGPGGVWVLDPDGRLMGVIEVPEVVANLTWGGRDSNDLYLTASSSLYRVHTKVSGSALAYP
jgi:gluconolactonase